MKIAMLGHKAIPSRLGGIEAHVENLSTRLAKRGHEVHAYNRSVYDPGMKEFEGVHLHNSFTVRKNSLEALIYSVVSSFQAAFGNYDIVHYHALGPAVMSFIPRLAGKKVVCTIHGLDWQRAKWGSFAVSYLKLGEKASVKVPHRTISVSQNLLPYFKKKYHKSVDYVPNGINFQQREDLEDLEEIMGIQQDKYLLFVARLVPEKGLHYLLEAYRKIDTDIPLVVAGDNPYNKEYTEKIKKMADLDSRVKMVGFQDFEVLKRLYSNAYAYILPSDIEGQPISLLEAMSFGCFCLVSNIPQNIFVIQNMGVSFEKGSVSSLEEELKNILQKGFKQSINFNQKRQIDYIKKVYDWDKVTQDTESIYQQILNKKKGNKVDMVGFFRNWIKHIKLFVILTVITFVANYFFVVRDYKPAYESNLSLLVGQNVQEQPVVDTYEALQAVQISEKLVFDIPEIVYGSAVLNNINLGLAQAYQEEPVTPEDIKKAVSTEIVKNSRVVNVSVKADDPAKAQMIASTIGSTVDTSVTSIMSKDYIHIIQEATFPEKITGMGKKSLIALGGVGGAILGFLAVLLITISQKKEDEVNH